MPDVSQPPACLEFLTPDGVIGPLIRSRNWSSTALGAIEYWPRPLQAIVGLILHSKVPMFVAWGDALTFLYNDSYAEVLGDKHPQALGAPFEEIWHEIWPDISPLIDAAMAGRSSYREDLPLVMNRKGFAEQTWFTFSYSPVFDESGVVAGMFCTCLETTEVVLAKRREADERERLARMFEQAPGFITILSGSQHVFEFVNASYRRLFGDRDYVGNPVRSVFPDLEGQDFFHILDEVFESGRRYVAERVSITFRRDPQGPSEERSLQFIYEPLTNAMGEVTGIFVEGQDMTEQRLAEAALRESDARLRALTDNLPGGMVYQVSTGPDGSDRRFLYLSQSNERLSGVPAAAVIADPMIPYRMVLPEDQPRLVAAEEQAIRTRTSLDIQVRFRRADGQVRWSHLLSAPREQPDGSIIWDGIQIDITAQKQAEEALRDLNESLERRVQERSAELDQAHEQLRQSQKMEAMGTLTGGVAHDFNNLLSPIIGSLDLLQRRQLGDERVRRLISGALESAERAKTLVQRLLAFARRQPLQPKPVDVGELVRGMADLIDSTTGPQIKVLTEIAEDLQPAIADANQVEMAILNLSVNARDAMPEGGALRLSVSSELVPPENSSGLAAGRYTRLSVADTGIGMDENTLQRSIEPFFSTKGVGRGTGLGLSMAHGLASQLGGALTIASKPGVGTNVEIWLPSTTNAVAEQAGPESLRRTYRTTGIALVVDDEGLVRMSTADMLADLGYEVLEASSAQEALSIIDEGHEIDVLVTDHLMPGLSGTELAHAVRSSFPNIKILLASGYADLEGIAPDVVRLVKPFRQEDLAAKLAEAIER